MSRARFYRVAVASAVSLLALNANAADMYRAPEGVSYKDAPVYEPAWTGFYVGVNGGYGWSDDSKVTASGYLATTGSTSFSSDGGFGGGQIGYNWLLPGSAGYKDGPAPSHIVLGVEADIQGAGINGSGIATADYTGPTVAVTATGKSDLDWFGTVRGRIGYAAGPTLFYFTGGFAFGGVNDSLTSTAAGTTKVVSSNTTETGYVLGGGVEHFFSPRWSGKVEYQYIDLGSDKLSTTTGGVYGTAATLDAEHTYNTVRLGLNYHFGTELRAFEIASPHLAVGSGASQRRFCFRCQAWVPLLPIFESDL